MMSTNKNIILIYEISSVAWVNNQFFAKFILLTSFNIMVIKQTLKTLNPSFYLIKLFKFKTNII